MDWMCHAESWPMAPYSRFSLCKPHRWHVQEAGTGETLLLIHGAGGSTHSWRHLWPLLAERFHVIAVDLPGQGFSRLGARTRCGLDEMAHDLQALCTAEGWQPSVIVGHSAGAAIALRLAERMAPMPPAIVGINAALAPFEGVAGVLFPVLAKTLSMLPMIPDLFSAMNRSEAGAQRLVTGTGSKLGPEGIAFYQSLISDRAHVDATLQMMAQWNLGPLLDRLAQNQAECLLITGGNDKAVPPNTSKEAAKRLPNAQTISLPGLGHLAHEEDADAVFRAITEWLDAKD